MSGCLQINSQKWNLWGSDELKLFLPRERRESAIYFQADWSFVPPEVDAANRDLDVLLSSGYFANSTNRAQSPLDKPAITGIENEAAQQLLVRVTPIDNARSYHVQTNTNGNGTWQDAGIHPQARRIVLPGLTSGTVYNVRVRAIGGSTGASDWSDPQSHIST